MSLSPLLKHFVSPIVLRFEEIEQQESPGFGDDRWPFVVHFLGCRACDGFGQPEIVQNCIEQMDRLNFLLVWAENAFFLILKVCFVQNYRAFNFGDNQLLSNYGLRHLNLQSSVVQKLNRTRKNP